jgi:hypothetical protein
VEGMQTGNLGLIKFLMPVLLATSFFGWLIVYRRGWDAATYGGADVWGLFFEAMGGAFAPTAVALLVAGLVKLFKRDANFFTTWLTVFLIAFVILAVSSFTVARYERASAQEALSPELIDILKASHAETCQVVIRNQSQSQGLGMTEAEIGAHCRCVGDAYFASFAQQDFDEMQQTGQLPRRLLDRREDIQVECFVGSLAE